MFRKDLVNLLLENAMSVADIARMLEMHPREVEDNVRHLLKSIRHKFRDRAFAQWREVTLTASKTQFELRSSASL